MTSLPLGQLFVLRPQSLVSSLTGLATSQLLQMFTDSRKANRTFLHRRPWGRLKSHGSLPERNGFGRASCLSDFLLYLSV